MSLERELDMPVRTLDAILAFAKLVYLEDDQYDSLRDVAEDIVLALCERYWPSQQTAELEELLAGREVLTDVRIAPFYGLASQLQLTLVHTIVSELMNDPDVQLFAAEIGDDGCSTMQRLGRIIDSP